MIESLKGVRVLSLAEQYPGPYATMLLADLGADVIMIERPAGGDPSRRYTGHFEALNRNKRSVAINLKSLKGREVFLTLVGSADVVIEGFRPGVVDRLGISASQLRNSFRKLIYVSISGFGQDGPLRDRAGHDLSIQAAAGLLPRSTGANGPELPSLPLADLSSAMFAAVGTLAALVERQRSGTGTYIDVSMLDTVVSWMSPQIVSALNELTPAPHPPPDPGYGVFTTMDGQEIALSIAGEDHLWLRLCEGLALGDLSHLREVERSARSGEIDVRLRKAIAGTPAASLESSFKAGGIPFVRVNRGIEVVDDPQVKARRLIAELPDPDGIRNRKYVRQPLVFGGQRSDVTSTAPVLGQHTRDVLAESGYTDEEIYSLLADGIVAAD